MTITLPLDPVQEATLIAVAKAKGISADDLVRQAVDKLLTEQAASRPIWELIQDNMKDVPPEEFAKLPQDGASEHDHYLYGHPKRPR